ncbi:MAG: hypothetical protein R8G66_29025 [Cytophagales bacterium]|nr:hypothetical protein [Cytophagales bacterium]
MNAPKKFGRLIVVVIISYLGFSLYVILGPDIENYKNRIEFDAEQWKNWEESEDTMSLRWDMTHSLTTNYELVGMSTDVVIALLGEPSRKSNADFYYYLGMTRNGIDTGSLMLELENGKVVSYKVRHG